MNNSSANQLGLLIGVSEDVVTCNAYAAASNDSGSNFVSTGIGIDANTNSAQIRTGFADLNKLVPCLAEYNGQLTNGYHELLWLEMAQAFGTTVWYGDNGSNYVSCGMSAHIWG